MSFTLSQLRLEIDRQSQHFLTHFADIELLERTMRDATTDQHRRLLENRKRLVDQGLEDLSSSHHNMSFRSLSTGEHIFYHARSRTSEEIRVDLLIHQNKQYQWLLAEGYEAFEDYVEFVYAVGGILHEPLWRPAELLKLKAAWGSNPSLDAYKEWAANPRYTGDVLSKMERFRSTFPGMSAVEADSPHYPNPKFQLALIEMLRHVVVHNSGRVKNKDAFVQRIFARSGASPTGVEGPAMLGQIREFLGERNGEIFVHLLDIPVQPLPGAYVSRIEVLLDLLLAYANYICTEVLLYASE